MAQLRLGRTRVLANPVARSGRGAAAAERVQRFFDAHPSATTSFSLSLTKRAGHAGELASTMDEVDTLIVLGGDGIIHEAVNGLMRLPHHSRPDLAVIPMGSGNDFARTIHASINDPERALDQIISGRRRRIDLEAVTSDTGASAYVVQTLSFGLDAAIALDTTRRRDPFRRIHRASAAFRRYRERNRLSLARRLLRHRTRDFDPHDGACIPSAGRSCDAPAVPHRCAPFFPDRTRNGRSRRSLARFRGFISEHTSRPCGHALAIRVDSKTFFFK